MIFVFLIIVFISIQIEYKSLSEARHLFDLGYLSGFIDIGGNFSRELIEKISHW